MKALVIAASEGQKIYTITPANAATALPKLTIGGDMRWEIESAVQAGREVTVHERPINAHGYSGYGYMIVDPETGAGAYLIEGKGNGAILIFVGISLIMLAIAPALSVPGIGLSWLLNPAFITAFAGLIGAGIGYIIAGYGYITKDNTLVSLGFSIVASGLGMVTTNNPYIAIACFVMSAMPGLPFVHFL